MSNNPKLAVAGNKGDSVRSDCYVELKIKNEGGLQISLESKVRGMYGASIKQNIQDVLSFYSIKHASVHVVDTGALPFVIQARIEAAIHNFQPEDRFYEPEIITENLNASERDCFRFSRLYLPGNTPKLMINAGIHHPDGIILDLEDAVAPAKKQEARFLVKNALRSVNFYGAERMVRINQLPEGLKDLAYIIPHGVQLILFPKCEHADQIVQLEAEIKKIKLESMADQAVWLMPIIESSLGVIHAYEIAISSENIVAMAIGLEDYTADLGTLRSADGKESFFARTQVVNACRAAGIQPIDSVFSDVADMKALEENVKESKKLGFDGMGCIHPRQIAIIHQGFAPEEAEVEKARKIVKAFLDAESKGLGVVSLGAKMIDPPVVKRAQRIISLAVKLGKLDKDWIKRD